jgi:hypothetical protein
LPAFEQLCGPDGKCLILLGEVDWRRCDRRAKAGVRTGYEDRSATCTDRGRVRRSEGNVELRVEQAGYRTDVQVCTTCGDSDEGEDVREGPVGCGEIVIVSRASVCKGMARDVLVSIATYERIKAPVPGQRGVGSNACSRSYTMARSHRKVSTMSVSLSLKFWLFNSGTS